MESYLYVELLSYNIFAKGIPVPEACTCLNVTEL